MSESDDKKLEKSSRMAAIDIVTSFVVMAVSIIVIYWSLQMPWEEWERAPGLIPVLFAGTMFLMGIALMVSAIRNSGLVTLSRILSEFSFKKFLCKL